MKALGGEAPAVADAIRVKAAARTWKPGRRGGGDRVVWRGL